MAQQVDEVEIRAVCQCGKALSLLNIREMIQVCPECNQPYAVGPRRAGELFLGEVRMARVIEPVA